MSNRVSTSTNTKLIAKLVDQVLNGSPLLGRILSDAQKWQGEKISQPITVSSGTSGTSFDSFDTLPTSASDRRRKLEFEAKFYDKNVTVAITEIAKNMADPSRPFELTAAEVRTAAQEMADEIATIFYGTGAGNAGKDFLGMEAIVDNATNAVTYGTLSRSTFSVLNSTVTASGGSLTLNKMATLYSAISDGAIAPSAGYTTTTIWNLYETLLNPQERIVKDEPMMRKAMTGGTGFKSLHYKGFPIFADKKCTSGVLYFVNEDYLEFRALPFSMPGYKPVPYRLEIKGNDYTNVEGLGFSFRDFVMPIDQHALVGHIVLGGQLWSSSPRRHGKLTGITTA